MTLSCLIEHSFISHQLLYLEAELLYYSGVGTGGGGGGGGGGGPILI